MIYSLYIDQKRKDFLLSEGFEQTYGNDNSKPIISMGVRVRMEKWSKYDDYNIYHLYIRFDETESAYCNLYCGSNTNDAEVFSYRNLISEIKKRFPK